MEYRFPEEAPEGTIVTDGRLFFKREPGATSVYRWWRWSDSLDSWSDPVSWYIVVGSSYESAPFHDATENELIEAGIIKPKSETVTVSKSYVETLVRMVQQGYTTGVVAAADALKEEMESND